MLRSIIAVIFVVVFLIICLPVLGIEWIIGKFNRKAADTSLLTFVKWAFRVVIAISGTHVDVQGEENVPKDRAVVYAANHLSIFDVVITYARVPSLTGYIAKESLLKIPVFGTLMKRLYSLGLDRDNPKQGLKVVLKAIDYAKEGISIFIFPEGTRSRDGKLGQFHAGSFKIATRSGAPVIPVAITGTNDILEDHFPILKSKHVSLTYGRPIETASMSKEEQKELCGHVRDEIAEILKSQGSDETA